MYSSIIKIGIAFLDTFLIILAFFTAFHLKFTDQTQHKMEEYVWLLYFSVPIIILFLFRRGMLTGYRYRRKRNIFFNTVYALIQAGFISSAVLYLTHASNYSRLLFGSYFVLAAVFVVFEKMSVKCLYDWALIRGFYNIRAVLIGWGERAQRILDTLSLSPQWGIQVLATIDPRKADVGSIEQTLQERKVNEIFISIPRNEYYHQNIDAIIQELEPYGLPIKTTLNFDDILDMYAEYPCKVANEDGLLLAHHRLSNDQIIVKRIFDLFGSIIGLTLSSILFLPLVLAIKLDSSGPIFYKHRRVGKNGLLFFIYKFRSMYKDADQRLQDILTNDPQAKKEWEQSFKLKNDPRITKVGNFLRKTSLDELPQFINVFKGEMSLVGARPIVEKEITDYYKDKAGVYCSLKPGITGLWQAERRSETEDYEERVQMDRWYVKNYSLWLDIKIILKTVRAVVARKGAY